MKRTLALLLICATVLLAADTQFILPVLGKTPVIDGKIETTECLTVQGVVKHNSLFLSARQGTLHFALTPDSFYFAATSQLPSDGVQLLDRVKKRNGGVFLDDNVELDLTRLALRPCTRLLSIRQARHSLPSIPLSTGEPPIRTIWSGCRMSPRPAVAKTVSGAWRWPSR